MATELKNGKTLEDSHLRTRTLISVFIGIALLIGFGGCGGAIKQITAESQSMRTDVFTEIKDEQPPAEGSVDLTIKASIKTPPEGYYLLESRSHVKEGYPFLFNIDGQAVAWKVEGKSEITPRWDENGRVIPEGGRGIRYVLDKKIRLRPGSHHLFFGLPDEKYYTEVEISLKEGEPHTLEFQPSYVMGRKHHRSFFHGIKSYDVFLDGTHIK
jgi:hypothetical protein